jgi:hypothetical protein
LLLNLSAKEQVQILVSSGPSPRFFGRVAGPGISVVSMFLFFLWSGILFAEASASSEAPRLRSKAYQISEIYNRSSPETSDYEPLKNFLVLKLLSASDQKILEKLGLEIRSLSTALAQMQWALDSAPSPESLSRQERDFWDIQKLHYQEAQNLFAREATPEALLEKMRISGELAEQERDELLGVLKRYSEDAEKVASEIWEIRTRALDYGRQKEAEMSKEEFARALDKNQLWVADTQGRAELNSIDGVKMIRVLHPALREAIRFRSSTKINPKSHHDHKYIAAQHQKAGKDSGDLQRGRDVIDCWVSNGVEKERVKQVRFYPRPHPWKNYRQYREDSLLFLSSKFSLDAVKWGLVMGFLQAVTLAGMDALMHLTGVDNRDYRWELYLFTWGFSTFWGFFQPQLGKFTNDPFFSKTEKNLRRSVTTGLTYNIPAYLATYGMMAFDLTSPSGWINWAKLAINITLSNLVKDQMEKPTEVDERLRLNTGEFVVMVPSRYVPGQALSDNLIPFVVSDKKRDFDRRVISLKTFTYRLADITDLRIRIPMIDFDLPIGKIMFWSAYPYYQWKAVKHAEAMGSDLAPILRAKWEAPLSHRMPILNQIHKPFLFKYIIPIIPAGSLGASAIRGVKRAVIPPVKVSLELINRSLFTDQKDEHGELKRVGRLRALGQSLKSSCRGALAQISRTINSEPKRPLF